MTVFLFGHERPGQRREVVVKVGGEYVKLTLRERQTRTPEPKGETE